MLSLMRGLKIAGTLPPMPHKDLRAWFLSSGVAATYREACLALGNRVREGRW
jgi:hypothetical protein